MDVDSTLGAAMPANRLIVNLPATMPMSSLLDVLGPSDGMQAITEERIRTPDEALLLHVYSTLLNIPTLRDALALQETQQQEYERRLIDMETQLHDAEHLKSEAEQRSERDRMEKEQVLREKSEVSAQLAQVQGTLASLQSTEQSGSQQTAQLKGRIDQVEQEKLGILEMFERERIECARRAEEVDNLTKRNRESRAEISRLSTELQESKSSESTAKFRVQSLEQEVTLKAKDAAWAHNELEKTTDELAQYRVRISEEMSLLNTRLQQQTSNAEMLESKLQTLQSTYNGVTTRMDSLTREKSELRQRLAEQEGSFQAEMNTQQRLSTLMEQQKDVAEQRLNDVEQQWEKVLAQHRDREDALQDELEQKQDVYDALVREKEEIQQALDRLAESVGIDTNGYQVSPIAGNNNNSAVSTPRRGLSGLPDSSAIMSPTAALASRVQKSGKSFTQVYADLAKAEEELRRERAENIRLVSVLEQVMTDLHERAPALQAQREEKENLEQYAEELSTALANACQERDLYEREAKDKQLQAEAAKRENGALTSQVADLSQQVRDLIREIILRDEPSAAERLVPDGSIVNNGNSLEASESQDLITEQLVTYRNLTELVSQNARLLRVVRDLSSEVEKREAKFRSTYEEQESEAVSEAKQLIIRMQEELRTERTRAEGIRRERDMFRAMTAQGRGTLVAAPTAESSTAHVTLTNQYSELQGRFEAFRSETANDMERLKEEAFQARSDANKNALVAAKEKATRESVEERLANVQQTYNFERKELQDLQRRHNAVQESLSRQEISVQTLSQQLVSAQGNVERLRNEVSNLSAERQLHKETADRLIEERQASTKERNNLSELLRSSQTMQAELERASAEVRRSMDTQLSSLEEQVKETRDRLSKEEDAHRQTTLRREVETTDLRSRLDRANEALAKSQEELAVARTNVQHLTGRVEELQRQVDSKDEKLAVYERRPAVALQGVQGQAAQEMGGEQHLQIQLAELRGELRSAQVEAEQSRAHVEQYKSIASANEEALAELQTTHDEYKALTDASISSKNAELVSLQERVAAVVEQLSSAQDEATAERQQRLAQAEAFRTEKKTLEDALSEVTAVEDRAKSNREGMQEEVRRQEQLTHEANARYQAELLAHAEDIRALSAAKEQLDVVRTQLLEAQKVKEIAEGNLASSTDSWIRQRQLLEAEKDELKVLLQELRGQNDALHNHLESLQSQISEIRQAGGAVAGDISISSQAGNDEMQEVIRYLRREKEIVDLQVELREQECARLRQSVEHTQKSLDEVRVQLSQEREQNAGASATAKQHEELMEKINQLSILRESNTTLRDEAERSQRKVQILEEKVEALTRELDPIREELRVKTVELEACQNQLQLSQEDNKRWQGRTQSILQQYNRIDPDELRSLQEKKDAAEAALAEQKVTVDAKQKELDEFKEKFKKLREQTVERLRTSNARIKELENDNEQLRTAAAAGGEESETLKSLQAEFEALTAEKQELDEQLNTLQSENEALHAQVQELQMQPVSEPLAATGEDQEEAVRIAVEEAEKIWAAERATMEATQKQISEREQRHLQRAKEFNTSMKNAHRERDELLKEKEEWQSSQSEAIEAAVTERLAEMNANGGEDADGSDKLATLQQRITELESKLQEATQKVEELEAGGQILPSVGDNIDELRKEHAEALRAQEAQLSAQYLQRQKQAIEIAVQKATAAAANNVGAGDDFEAAREAELQSMREMYEQQGKERFEAGKQEANLRHQLLLKKKDSKIESLTKELNFLKGIPDDTSPAAPGAAAQSAKPAIASVRGGAAPKPIALRGGAPTRGVGRGGAQATAGAQKRTASASGVNEGESPGDSDGSGQLGGNATKKPRPLSVRGGGAGAAQRGGAAGNRGGGRGGAP